MEATGSISSLGKSKRMEYSNNPQQSVASATTRKIKRKPLNSWNEEEVVSWMKKHLEEEYFARYGAMFKSQGISGKTLMRMTEDILLRMGIKDPNHRHELLTKIQLLQLKNDLVEWKRSTQ